MTYLVIIAVLPPLMTTTGRLCMHDVGQGSSMFRSQSYKRQYHKRCCDDGFHYQHMVQLTLAPTKLLSRESMKPASSRINELTRGHRSWEGQRVHLRVPGGGT